MKLLKTTIPGILLLLLLGSCRKDDIRIETEGEVCPNGYDTVITKVSFEGVESSGFIAAYPGSWWVLSNGDTLKCEAELQSGVMLEKTDESNCEVVYTETEFSGSKIVGPYTNNFTKGFIDGDDQVVVKENGEINRAHVMDTWLVKNLMEDWWTETSSSGWENNKAWSWVKKKRLIHFYETYALPNGDVYENVAKIEVKYIYDALPINYFEYEEIMYYSWEIGLIRYFQPENDVDYEPEQDVYIVDYYIAPH